MNKCFLDPFNECKFNSFNFLVVFLSRQKYIETDVDVKWLAVFLFYLLWYFVDNNEKSKNIVIIFKTSN